MKICMHAIFLALVMGIVLLGTFIEPAFGAYVSGYPNLKATDLTLDPLAECTNDLQCNATFLAGDIVTFTGQLLDRDGKFVRDATVNIYRLSGVQLQLLTSAVTERDGTFKAIWKARFMDQKSVDETFKQQIREVSTVFAKFEDNDKYAASKSGVLVITVKIPDVLTHVATDKHLYESGNTALIFVNFIQVEMNGSSIKYGDFIDPDSMRVTYDGKPVELSKKKQGSYTFVTPALTVGHHQLVINPAKGGYNTSVGFITVQVSGFFGK